ncbi:hypothetical protein SSX86_006949 [Deinandra increscens subsp. villosa]|uniref:Uncharacterized protein n=1 Tax=Deinandra increscens subsp. villosa TaxID=3103831 RepID=A0AAP0DFV2_9ASTR
MKPPPHKHFFSSLKQVEKRLKLDDSTPAPAPPQTETQSTESSCGSPIYIHNHQTNTSSTLHEQPPQEFLSINDINDSEPNPNPNQNQNQNPKLNNPATNFSETTTVGDVDSMIRLLKLSDFDGKAPEMPDLAGDEFYDKIVKVKGPKCKEEVERLDNWIKYLSSNSGREPLRLAHLLMAKAVFVSASRGGGGGGDGMEFPSTVDEFLRNDPPSD